MNCISPIRLKQKGKFQDVPCGRCIHCLKRKRSEWLLRLEHEHRASCRSLFVTLTYNDENIPFYNKEPCFDKGHVQKFFKRLRHISTFRYYLVSEYGSKYGRPHYHLLLFNYKGSGEDIQRCWPYGFIHVGSVTSSSINYVAAYTITRSHYDFDKKDPRRPFSLSSRKPGIGYNYVETHKKYHQKSKTPFGVRDFGQRVSLPRYYKEKVFTKFERDVLAQAYKKKVDEDNSVEDWLKNHPGKSYSDYALYQQQLYNERSKRYVKLLKQNRNEVF